MWIESVECTSHLSITCSCVGAYLVACLQLVCRGILNGQVGLLDMGQSGVRVMGQSADWFSSRHEVVRVAAEVGLETTVTEVKVRREVSGVP